MAPEQVGRRFTKLVVSVPPETCDEALVGALIGAGMDVISFADTDDDVLEQAVGALRAGAHNARTPIGVLVRLDATADLAGRAVTVAGTGVDFLAFADPADGDETAGVRGALAPLDASPALLTVGPLAAGADGAVVAPDQVASVLAQARPAVADGDIAEAVAAGADAVLVTASDGDITAAVRDADAVVRRAEAGTRHAPPPHEPSPGLTTTVHGLIAEAAPAAVFVLPAPGTSSIVRALAAARPAVPVVGLAPTLPDMLGLSILGGVIPRFARPDERDRPDLMLTTAVTQLGLAADGDTVVTVEPREGGRTDVGLATV